MFCPILWSLHQTHGPCTESYISHQQRSISNSNWKRKFSAFQNQTGKIKFVRCSFGRERFFNIRYPEWKLFWGFETNSANFLIRRKSQTQLLANFYNALVNSILNLYIDLWSDILLHFVFNLDVFDKWSVMWYYG